MAGALSAADMAAFHDNGCLFPIRVLSAQEIAGYRRRLEDFLPRARANPEDNARIQYKAHLLFTWVDELVRHPAILNVIESLLGPDILVWNSGFLLKQPYDPGFVSWHQDATYWGVDAAHVVSAWLALSDSTAANGCVQMVPGSHHWGAIPHVDTFGENNLLSRGQQVSTDIDPAQVLDVVLRAGEMSMHHALLVHGSRPNVSAESRLGLVINYVDSQARRAGAQESAMRVRGADSVGQFEPEPRPVSNFDAAAIAVHAAATRRQAATLYKGSTPVPKF